MKLNYKFKTEPFEHQLKALGCSWNKESFAYFMEMGTGKSKVLIDNIAMLYDKGQINGALIVAPKGVYTNWKGEQIQQHMPDHVVYKIVVWNPSPTKKEKEELNSLFKEKDCLTIFLMNIEAFSTTKGKDIATKFLLAHSALFAIDESTTIKTPTAARTKAVVKIRNLAKYRRILTGSPVTKSPLDLYSQAEFLDPGFLDQPSFWTFKSRYCVMVKRRISGSHQFNMIVDYKNIDELSKLIDKFSFRVLKDECLDLPEKVYMTRNVELSPKQLDAYYQLKEFAVAELKEGSMTTFSALTQLMRLHQVTCGFMTTDDGRLVDLHDKKGKIPRLETLLDLLDEIDGKVIIWANYRHNIQHLTKAIRKKYGHDSCESFYGDTKQQDREDILSRFRDPGSRLNYFVANPKTGGYGLNLTVSHTIIYYSNNYDLEVRMQSEDRIHRIGQTSKATYIDLVAKSTIDENIIKALKSKINLASKVLGEKLKEWLQ
jgi:SNF2 family DNA or RNA helicase|tara:strand:+ start:2429 stop:3889 length:1461 start_codon:yes stop_codon:yes gene_type:complete